MTKKIFRSIITVGLVVLLSSLFMAATCIYNYFNKMQVKQLKEELELVKVSVNRVGIGYFQKINSSMFRFTVIDEDGSVLYDNVADAGEMENHREREEIREAFETGYGSSARNSSTLTKKTFYEAVLLESGDVLRVSVSCMTLGALFLGMSTGIWAIVFVAGIISFLLASKMTKKIIEPLNKLDLDNPMENYAYEELSPILKKINRQHRQIKRHMDEMKRKSDEFDQITSSMSEGLILLDAGGRIISINNACKKIYDVKEELVGKSLLSADRSPQMSKAVKEALGGGHAGFITQKKGYEYQFNVNPIESEGEILGAVILAFDITEKAFAERNRREFTANVTHELKTPLQSILGSAELLESGLAKPEDRGRLTGNIQREAMRLLNLINDIIRLSDLDENREPATETVNLREVAQEVVEVLRASAEKKDVVLEIKGDACVIFGVRRYIYEILYNLCDNAVRYNTNGGKVTVDIHRENNRNMICVSDTGIGIDVKHHARIFERFYRVDKSHSKETGGTGLGLSIVKHAVMYHKGKIELESEVGKGTTIKVTF